MTRRVFYMAHPIGATLFASVDQNVRNAKKWLAWLMRCEPGIAFNAPYLPCIEAGANDADPEQRARGMADNIAHIHRSDGIVLVGGRLSQGMATELEHAEALDLAVYDLLALGPLPNMSTGTLMPWRRT